MKRINTLMVVLLSSLVLGACNNTSSESKDATSDVSMDSTSSTETSTTSGQDEGGTEFLNKSYKVELQGDAWDMAMGNTNQIYEDGTKQADKVELLKNHLNSNNGEDSGLISSMDGTCVFNGKYLEEAKVHALQLGNAKSSMGELTLNFAMPISKIEVKVEGYSKPYTVGGDYNENADQYSILAIGTSENPKMKVLDMSVTNPDKADLPVILTGSVEFTSGASSITFKGIGDESFSDGAFASGRTMFHYINFYY